MSKLTLKEVNNMTFKDFMSSFGSVIEEGRWVASCVYDDLPFSDINGVCVGFAAFLRDQPFRNKIGIVRCYPDLAGKLSQVGDLSNESTQEHKAAGLLELTQDDRESLFVLNTKYKERFGFPFVVCARENKLETIKRGLLNRVENTKEEEVNKAIEEVVKIAGYRIKDLIMGSCNL